MYKRGDAENAELRRVFSCLSRVLLLCGPQRPPRLRASALKTLKKLQETESASKIYLAQRLHDRAYILGRMARKGVFSWQLVLLEDDPVTGGEFLGF